MEGKYFKIYPCASKGFWIPKAYTTKARTDKWDYIELRSIANEKTETEKYLQTIHLRKD
jgi:hypothetical protein